MRGEPVRAGVPPTPVMVPADTHRATRMACRGAATACGSSPRPHPACCRRIHRTAQLAAGFVVLPSTGRWPDGTGDCPHAAGLTAPPDGFPCRWSAPPTFCLSRRQRAVSWRWRSQGPPVFDIRSVSGETLLTVPAGHGSLQEFLADVGRRRARLPPSGRVEDGRSGLGHPASPCFSSNRTCQFLAFRLSDWLHRGHTAGGCYERLPYFPLALASRYSSFGRLPVLRGASQACAKSPTLAFFDKHTRSQGASLHRHYPASTALPPCPTPVPTGALQHR